MSSSSVPSSYLRLLQSQSNSGNEQGRTILTIMYLSVLALCFLVPIVYFIRLHCEERHMRRLRDLEMAGVTAAMENSSLRQQEESLAARRKFRDERRARILQLLAPVRMILKEEHFPHLRDTKQPPPLQQTDSNEPQMNNNPNITQDNAKNDVDTDKNDAAYSDKSDADKAPSSEEKTMETDTATFTSTTADENITTNTMEESKDNTLVVLDDDDDDDHSTCVEIPVPGLPQLNGGPTAMRLVPNYCSICLENYQVGSDIVWSTNEACPHMFHEECLEEWLMKQREGPLCPCCRRDFILDPFDLVEDEDNNNNTTNIQSNDDEEYDLELAGIVNLDATEQVAVAASNHS